MVYWYLPKTSCTTMKWYFANHLGLVVPKRDGTDLDIHGQDIGFEFTEDVIDGMYNWAYVRNPFDRISSLYSQKIHKNVDRKVFPDENIFYKGMPFEEFIDAIITIENKERHYIPQSEMLDMGIYTHKMENDLFLRMLKPRNVSEKLDVWTKETKHKAFKFYKNDFIRFGYHYQGYGKD